MNKKGDKDNKRKSFIYGPVLSRRFGYSLGIDLVPLKVCTYDCIYCQLGRTTNKTIKRADYACIDPEDFRQRIKEKIKTTPRIDFITFSGSGEPTLNSRIREYIGIVKGLTDIPLLLLTGGGLLWSDEVMEDIMGSDVIKVSLDAPYERLFKKINRPCRQITYKMIMEGLSNLKKYYKGRIWLEIMVMDKINDSKDTACMFKDVLDDYESIIEKIHLNTPTRSQGVETPGLPERERLEKFKEILGSKAQLIPDISKYKIDTNRRAREEEILGLIKVRPSSAEEIAKSLSININETVKILDSLTKEDKVWTGKKGDKKLYRFKDIF